MSTKKRTGRHAASKSPLPIGFLLALILLGGAGCTSRAEPRPQEEPEPAKAPEAYFSSLRSWEDFLVRSEAELSASMPAEPDTAVTAEDQRVLVYHLEPNEVARFFILSEDRLAEDLLIFYFPDKADARALYERAAAYFGGLHGEPSLQYEEGTLWNLRTETATDSLREVITAIRKGGSLPSDSLTLGDLLDAAPEARQHRLIDLFRRHRSARVYMGAHLLANVYTVTISRAAGPNALWSDQGEQIRLESL